MQGIENDQTFGADPNTFSSRNSTYQIIVTLILSEWGRRDEGGQVRTENVQLREYSYN